MTAHRPTGDGAPVIEVKEVGNSAGDGLAREADGHAVKSANEGLPGSEIGSGKGGQAEVAPMSKEQAILLYSLRTLQVCVYDALNQLFRRLWCTKCGGGYKSLNRRARAKVVSCQCCAYHHTLPH